MPSCLSCLPFLRSRPSRSPSPKPPLASPRDEAVIPHPTCLDPSPALLFCPSSRQGVLEKNVNVTTTGASHSPAGDLRASDYFSDQPSQAPRPVTPSGFIPSNAIRMSDPHGSVAHQPIVLAPPSNRSNSDQIQQLLAPSPQSATPTQQSLKFEPLAPPSGQHSPQQHHPNTGIFNKARKFSAAGNFINGNVGSVTYISAASNHFMKELMEKTIPGAEFDSSDRDPPPRCHPGTRLAILDRCIYFICTCVGNRKMRWVVGAAGVGKSAVMQSVVESPELAVSSHASVFFSINGRYDGIKAVITISYQFAVKCESYRQLIEKEITHDPSLLRSSMAKQFRKLIIEPFVHNPQLNSAGRFLIVIDGLDECKDPRTQLELLRLISDLCIKYPSSPLVWIIASRPELHITSFFSRVEVMPAYEKEEIPVNSNEARADVERFLRDGLTEIKKASDSVNPRWPEEQDLWKLANAAGGLFAYAQTVIRYIGDPTIRSPASQLSDVLNIIDNHPMTDVPREEHPMALLDALYDRILSNIPSKLMINARNLLLALISPGPSPELIPTSEPIEDDLDIITVTVEAPAGDDDFFLLCNWLGMTPDETYAAINHLRAVLYAPTRNMAHLAELVPFHKSFIDYISDFTRSRFSPDIQHEAQQLVTQCAFRIFNETPDGVDFGEVDYSCFGGIMRRGPGTSDKISLTWKFYETVGLDDTETRLRLYELAIRQVLLGIQRGYPAFRSEFCIRLLTTRFEKYNHEFPYYELRNLVFDESRRHEHMLHSILKQIPLQAVDNFAVKKIKLQFRCYTTGAMDSSDPWNSSCNHKREGKWEKGNEQDWMTYWPYDCKFCNERLQRQLVNCKTRSPDHAVLILFTSTCVEFQFVDPGDGMSEWTYWFWCHLSPEERRKYGSNV